MLLSAGDLDLSFGTGGVVLTPVGTLTSSGQAVAVDSAGRIVAAGMTTVPATQQRPSHSDIAVVRYTMTGALDSTFDGDGKVTTDFSGSGKKNVASDVANSIVIQPDGKIIVAGYTCVIDACFTSPNNKNFAMVRYNSNGSIDTSFGTGGRVTTALTTGYDEAFGVALQSNGKIVVVGSSASDFAVVRYNSNGSLDTTFNGTGKVFVDFTSNVDGARAVSIQSDGKIVVVGNSRAGANTDFAVARLNANGTLDTSWGGAGKVTTHIRSNNERANAGFVQADGKVVAAGYSQDDSNGLLLDFTLVRYDGNGSLDATFSSGGVVLTDFGPGTDDEIFAAAADSSGKILAAGRSSSSDSFFAVARYGTDGSLDPTFGNSGLVTTDVAPGPTDRAQGMAVQSDGKIILAGFAAPGGSSPNNFAVARYLGGGSALASATATRDSAPNAPGATETDIVIEDLLDRKNQRLRSETEILIGFERLLRRGR
jgi:uncharacterized delta-60 repeat protein